MTIDLSREFNDIDQAEWESPQQRQEYIHLTAVAALSLAVDHALEWLGANVKDSRWQDPEAERRFYEASLMGIFADRFQSHAMGDWFREQSEPAAQKHLAWAAGPNPYKEMVEKAVKRATEIE